MERIATASSYDIHYTTRFGSIVSWQRTRFNLKLLDCIRKGHRQADIRNGIHMWRAVQHEERLSSLPSRHRKRRRCGIVLIRKQRLTGHRAWLEVYGAPGQRDQLCDLPAIERSINHAVVINNLPHTVIAGLDHSGLRLHDHLLADRSYV